jgi:hypothetical protein
MLCLRDKWEAFEVMHRVFHVTLKQLKELEIPIEQNILKSLW